MNEILEILKYTLPALIVFFATWLTLRLQLKNEEKKRRFEITMSQKDNVLPLRLQAYERLILLLERISPDSLVMRIKDQRLTVAQLQNELINNIRTEFDHNLSQQTYVSSQAWETIKSARADIIKLINTSAAELKKDSPGLELSKRIIEKAMERSNSPGFIAIQFLKKEVKELF